MQASRDMLMVQQQVQQVLAGAEVGAVEQASQPSHRKSLPTSTSRASQMPEAYKCHAAKAREPQGFKTQKTH